MTLAYVVYFRGRALAVYVKREQAEWCAFLLGGHATIKKFTSKVLLQILTEGHHD